MLRFLTTITVAIANFVAWQHPGLKKPDLGHPDPGIGKIKVAAFRAAAMAYCSRHSSKIVRLVTVVDRYAQ
jgi:hypothetical protein